MILSYDKLLEENTKLEEKNKNLTKGTTVLINRIITLEEENKNLHALFDLQHTRTLEASKLWQEETSNPGVYPDLGLLIDWLLERKIDNI